MKLTRTHSHKHTQTRGNNAGLKHIVAYLQSPFDFAGGHFVRWFNALWWNNSLQSILFFLICILLHVHHLPAFELAKSSLVVFKSLATSLSATAATTMSAIEPERERRLVLVSSSFYQNRVILSNHTLLCLFIHIPFIVHIQIDINLNIYM